MIAAVNRNGTPKSHKHPSGLKPNSISTTSDENHRPCQWASPSATARFLITTVSIPIMIKTKWLDSTRRRCFLIPKYHSRSSFQLTLKQSAPTPEQSRYKLHIHLAIGRSIRRIVFASASSLVNPRRCTKNQHRSRIRTNILFGCHSTYVRSLKSTPLIKNHRHDSPLFKRVSSAYRALLLWQTHRWRLLLERHKTRVISHVSNQEIDPWPANQG